MAAKTGWQREPSRVGVMLKETVQRHHQWLVLLLVGFSLALLYHNLVQRRAVVDLVLDTDTRTILKVYWPMDDGRYTEQRMARVTISPNRHRYSFHICDLKGLTMLRLDPAERPARILLRSLTIRQQGYPELHFDVTSGRDRLYPLAGVNKFVRQPDGWLILSAGSDPQLGLKLPTITFQSTLQDEAARIAVILLLVFLAGSQLKPLGRGSRYVSCLAAVAFGLIMVMAVVSAYNHHPDEYVHVNAARYYVAHFMPPRIEAPEIRHTYSVYGVSRLHSGEIVYLLAGKFLWLLRPLRLPPYLALRFFNVILFLFLVLCAVRRPGFRIILLPVLVSAQIWYVFSYFNSDAFAVFISLLTGYQMAVPSSAFNRFLKRGMGRTTWWLPLMVGGLFALLLLLKKNFYFFYVFLFFYTLWRIKYGDWTLSRSFVRRFAAVLVIACCLAGFYKGTDYWVNGADRNDKLFQARRHLATRLYNPDTPLTRRHPYLEMKARGVPLADLLTRLRWGEKSFRSAFGVYDYLSISGPFVFYDYVRITGLLLLLVMIVPVLLRGGVEGITLVGITLSVALALLGMALYHAWTVDFQAQGRYFFPVWAMFSLYLYHERRYLINFCFSILVCAMYLLAIYSFLWVGILHIAKI